MIFSAMFGGDKDKGGDVANKNRTATGEATATAPRPDMKTRTDRRGPEMIGLGNKAKPRDETAAADTVGGEDAPISPDVVQLGANAGDSARAAALRARRKGAGSSALTALGPGGAATPGAKLNPRGLLGY